MLMSSWPRMLALAYSPCRRGGGAAELYQRSGAAGRRDQWPVKHAHCSHRDQWPVKHAHCSHFIRKAEISPTAPHLAPLAQGLGVA
jgi:hypothetical protein